MGKVYMLEKSDFNYDAELKNQIIIKEILTDEEADDFIRLQTLALSEISEDVSALTKSVLTTKNSKSNEGFIFCIAKDEGKCIGYGYGYIDFNNIDIFYLDTIGVDSQHRNKKIGTEIKVKLIQHAFENPKIEYIKAITQDDNQKTIHINKKLGFKDWYQIKLEHTLLETLLKKSVYRKSFSDIVNNFEEKLASFDPVNNCIEIEKYFNSNAGNGLASIQKKLLDDNVFKSEDIYTYKTKGGKNKTDVKGLYVFVHENEPIYVGISRGLVHRTLQHLRGKSHNTSTLAYNIGLIRHRIAQGEEYTGGRKDFDFNNNVTPAKDFLLKQKIAFLPIQNSEELYLFEIFCAMKLGCWLNKFETH